MVQKHKENEQPKRRGRPRAYNPDEALARAIGVFWKAGYSATSLDDLTRATGVNRPSLYLAFGDKRDLYLKALDHYWKISDEGINRALAPDVPLCEALMRIYRAALSFYFPDNGRPRGCFAISTATTEAVEDAKIRKALADGLGSIDAAFETRIRLAQTRGELSRAADPGVLAQLASATLYSLAIRSRAGWTRQALEMFASKAVNVICASN